MVKPSCSKLLFGSSTLFTELLKEYPVYFPLIPSESRGVSWEPRARIHAARTADGGARKHESAAPAPRTPHPARWTCARLSPLEDCGMRLRWKLVLDCCSSCRGNFMCMSLATENRKKWRHDVEFLLNFTRNVKASRLKTYRGRGADATPCNFVVRYLHAEVPTFKTHD